LFARFAGRFDQLVGFFGDFGPNLGVAAGIQAGRVRIGRRIELAVFENRHELVQDAGHVRSRFCKDAGYATGTRR
jgi:hypothetical protein